MFMHKDLFVKLFANTVFLIRNVFVVFVKEYLWTPTKKKAFSKKKTVSDDLQPLA